MRPGRPGASPASVHKKSPLSMCLSRLGHFPVGNKGSSPLGDVARTTPAGDSSNRLRAETGLEKAFATFPSEGFFLVLGSMPAGSFGTRSPREPASSIPAPLQRTHGHSLHLFLLPAAASCRHRTGYFVFMSIAAAFSVAPNNKRVRAISPQAVRGIATATPHTVSNPSLALGIVILETIRDEALPANATVWKNIAPIPRGRLIAEFQYASFGAAVIALAGAAGSWSRGERETS